jgi:hypothetical protein
MNNPIPPQRLNTALQASKDGQKEAENVSHPDLFSLGKSRVAGALRTQCQIAGRERDFETAQAD